MYFADMHLEIFLADFAVFRVFWGISRDFAGPRPRELSEALIKLFILKAKKTITVKKATYAVVERKPGKKINVK